MHTRKIVRATRHCGFRKFSISVIDIVDDDTRFDGEKPVENFSTIIEVSLDSPSVGNASISTYEILRGDYRKLADMFTVLAVEEENR